MIEEDKLGQVFRDALKNYEKQPSGGVWTAIQNKAPGTQPPAKLNPLAKNLLISFSAVVIIAVISWVAYKYFSDNNKTETIEKTIAAGQEISAVANNQPSTKVNPDGDEGTKGIHSNPGKNQFAPLNSVKKDTGSLSNKPSIINTKEKRDSSLKKETIVDADKPVQITKTNPGTESYKTSIKSETVQDESHADNVTATDISYDQEKTICKGSSVTLHASGGVTYNWMNGETTDSIVVSPAISTSYYVIISDRNGKDHKAIINVNVTDCNTYIAPKAFTPNGDGVLDIFFAYVKDVTDFQMIIFSRSGEKVFESRNPDVGWDGTWKGSMSPIGAYVYIIKFTDAFGKAHEVRGTVTLVR